MKEETIKEAAKDYEVAYELAKKIHDDDPDHFYENMEKYIKENYKYR